MRMERFKMTAGLLLVCCISFFMLDSSHALAKKSKPDETKQEQTKKSTWQPELRIGILEGESRVTLQVNVPSVLLDGKTEKRIVFFSPGKTMKIVVEGGKLIVDGKKVNASRIILRPQQKKPLNTMKITINGFEYPGGVDIMLMGGRMVVSNLVATEDYLRGVLPEEMPQDWPEEALKAQAVAARTYALQHRGRHEEDGYDLCDTTHCQVYEGLESAVASTDKAISDTYGEVLTYQGKLIDAFFHTDSGGMTDRCLDVWGSDVPYLQAAKELNLNTQPWSVSCSIKEFSAKLAAASKSVGTVKQVKLSKLSVGKGASDRSASGRVKSLVVKGDKGSKEITGNDMRAILGLRSTLFDINISKDQVKITGYGWGHGLGMSQWGAKAYAGKWSYDKILYHYYKGTKLKKLY